MKKTLMIELLFLLLMVSVPAFAAPADAVRVIPKQGVDKTGKHNREWINAIAGSRLRNEVWGPLMRAGVDKSLFARQVEKYADVYTSRVSNFAAETPYGFLRAARGTLPHDAVDGD